MMRTHRQPTPLLTLQLLVVCGIILNVAIAWTLPSIAAVCGVEVHEDGGDNRIGGRVYHITVASSVANRSVWFVSSADQYYSQGHIDVPDWITPPPRDPMIATWHVEQAGWPALSVQAHSAHRADATIQQWGMASLFGHERPYHPVWFGFIVNTLVYTLASYGLWRGVGAIRSGLRSSRNTCSRCGYDLRANTSPICPECGTER